MRRLLQQTNKSVARSLVCANLKRNAKLKQTRSLATNATAAATSERPKKYILSMFPYPSGKLHMGHVRVYTIADVLARIHTMLGYDVLHPMGWDAFGLPAENAAIERNVSPAEWTVTNIAQMKKPIEQLDCAFQWDRELATCTPEYYKWTQWIFLQLFKEKLAYQQEAVVNWDPVDNTVLANEQVDSTGRSWRSGAVVERKNLKQWFFNIRAFAEELEKDLDGLKEWPEVVKVMQRKWIGKSEGAEFEFKLNNSAKNLKVFTTRPDTIYGVTYLAIAPESNILEEVVSEDRRSSMREFVRRITQLTNVAKRTEAATNSKAGFYLGVNVIHPLTKEEIPLYVADYVIADFAEGCVMGVPAHDTRDFEFAKQHNLSIKVVIQPQQTENAETTECYTAKEGTLINSGSFDGLSVKEASSKIVELAEQNGVGKRSTHYRLRDWLISRQRYWGAPIPIIHCPKCGPMPVPEDQLPVKLPENIKLSGKGGSPLAQAEDWVNVKCPCGKGVDCKRDTDTMDTFVDSSWYYLRFIDPHNKDEIFNKDLAHKFMNVDTYIGGIEHAVMHLLYARFIYKFFHKQGYVPNNEPFEKLVIQGMVLGEAFKDPKTNKYYRPEEIEKRNGKAYVKDSEKVLVTSMEKMSKSKYNGIEPEVPLSKYGADAVRMYILFKAPVEKELEMDMEQMTGHERFLNRVQTLVHEVAQNESTVQLKKEERQLQQQVNVYIQNITEGITKHHSFNTSISEMHKWLNLLHEHQNLKATATFKNAVADLLLTMAPITPGFSSKMWSHLQSKLSQPSEQWNKHTDVHQTPYPVKRELPFSADGSDVVDEVKVVVQLKGKVKTILQMPANLCSSNEKVEQFITQNKAVQQMLAGKQIKKVIVANQGKVINFVTE